MRSYLLTSCLGAVAFLAVGAANANEELIKLSQNPRDWVMPAGNYANTRFSTLKQINTGNLGKLQVAWTFSSGVLRGHEGAPLVIGDVMYFNTPFPNGQKIDTSGSGVPPIFECQIASYDRPPSGESFENLSLRPVQIRAHDCVRIRSGLLAH